MWNETFEGKFIAPNEIELENFSSSSHYYSSKKKKIRFKVDEEGEVYIKCLVCTDTRKKLCEHQMTILQEASSALNLLDFKTTDFHQKIIASAAKKLNMTPQVVNKYFEARLSPDGPIVVGRQNNMVNISVAL